MSRPEPAPERGLPERGTTFRRIVATTDFTPGSKRAFRRALALARDLGAELHLLHVACQPNLRSVFFVRVSGDAMERLCSRARQRARRRMEDFLRGEDLEGVRLVPHVVTGHPAREIVAYAARVGADLIVVGERPESRGQHLLQHVAFESVGERVRRTAQCSVLTVR
ncbi:MAG: universal stress protein [Deltaproteobacteria bacterium]|nr:universal stress protein [Deltaproteobacteria bacterium]